MDIIDGIISDVQEQFLNGCATSYGEPQAWYGLDNGRSIEIVHEEEMLPANERFFSVRLHCTEEESDNGCFENTVGIITTQCSKCASDYLDLNALRPILKRILAVNDAIEVNSYVSLELRIASHYPASCGESFCIVTTKAMASTGKLIPLLSPSSFIGIGSCYGEAREDYIKKFDTYLKSLIEFRDKVLCSPRAYTEAVNEFDSN